MPAAPPSVAEERRREIQQHNRDCASKLLGDLFAMLPPADAGFPAAEREAFVAALRAVFRLVYGDDAGADNAGGLGK